MGEGYQVNAEALAQAGQQVSQQQSQAESLLSEAQGLNVDTKSWGLLGLATTFSKYSGLQSQLTDHLGKIGNGVGAIGANLTSTAEAYLEAEATNAQNLQATMPDPGEVAPVPLGSSGGAPAGGGSVSGGSSGTGPVSPMPTGVRPLPDATITPLPAEGGEPDWPTGDEQIETV